MKTLLVMTIFVQAATALADGFPFPTKWQNILECDNGTAVVGVNIYERRMLQIAIRNPGINRYLFGVAKDEVVIQGTAKQGVFNPYDFRGFAGQGATFCYHSGSAPEPRVFRDGDGLRFYLHQYGAKCCSETNSYGECVGNTWVVPERDLSDWYFRNCRVLN